MVSKYVINFLNETKWWKIYFISLVILPIGFVVGTKIAYFTTVISIVSFCVFLIINCIEGIINTYKFGRKDISWIKSIILAPIFFMFFSVIDNISKFIYHKFIFGDLPFSFMIFKYIIIFHLMFFLYLLVDFITDKPTQQKQIHHEK